MLKLTNDIIDGRITSQNREIVRIDDYPGNNKIRIKWKCLKCGNFWMAHVANVINNNRGCPKCANNIKLSNEIIDSKLQGINKDIIRVDEFDGMKKPISFKCLVCDNIWNVAPDHIINDKSGCRYCSVGKNEKIVKLLLINNNILFEHHKKLRDINLSYPNYVVDFYIPSSKIIIEYNGEQHYYPVRFDSISKEMAEKKFSKQVERDIDLSILCVKNKIKLITIDGRLYKYDILEQYMNDIVMPQLIEQ